MTAFFDTSAVIALSDQNEPAHAWSMQEFQARQNEGPIIINDVVYAELSAGLADQNAVDTIIQQFGFERAGRNDESLYNAGQCFKKYRHTNGGQKFNVLSDFFIGAVAKAMGIPLVTANPKDFRKYFSGLRIVSPDGEETTQ